MSHRFYQKQSDKLSISIIYFIHGSGNFMLRTFGDISKRIPIIFLGKFLINFFIISVCRYLWQNSDGQVINIIPAIVTAIKEILETIDAFSKLSLQNENKSFGNPFFFSSGSEILYLWM